VKRKTCFDPYKPFGLRGSKVYSVGTFPTSCSRLVLYKKTKHTAPTKIDAAFFKSLLILKAQSRTFRLVAAWAAHLNQGFFAPREGLTSGSGICKKSRLGSGIPGLKMQLGTTMAGVCSEKRAVQLIKKIFLAIAFGMVAGAPTMTETWLQTSGDHGRTFRPKCRPQLHRDASYILSVNPFRLKGYYRGDTGEEPSKDLGFQVPRTSPEEFEQRCEDDQTMTLRLRGGMGKRTLLADKVYKKRKDIIERDSITAKNLKAEEEELPEEMRGLTYEERLKVAFEGKDPEEIRQERKQRTRR
jgi:hypothetical protein